MAVNENDDDVPPTEGGDLPVPDLRTMEELLSGADANKHLEKFLHVTQSIKVNGVIDDALRLYLFPYSLTHHATSCFNCFPRNSITTFEQMAKMFLEKYFPPSMVTKLRNEIINFRQRPDESLFEAWERYIILIDRCPNHNMLPVTKIDTFYNGLTLRHRDTINAAAGETFMKRRPEECYDLIENITAHHNYWDTSAQRTTVGQTQNVYAAGAYNQGGNSYQPQGNHNLLSYRLDNYLGPPGFNQNQNRSNPNQNYQNRNQGNNHAILRGTTKEETNSSKELPWLILARVNLMPLSVWKILSLPELSPTCMTLELADRSISRPVGVAKDVFVKVETFYFPADFVVVDFDADPRVPLILGRSFLKIGCALIHVYEGELTLRVGNKAVTFNLDQTSRYSANYDIESINRINVIDVACKEYSPKVLGFSVSGNPTPSTEPIVSISSPTLTPFGDSDFLLEETDAFLAIEDEPISLKIDDPYYDSEGYILLLEEFLNDDPSSPPLPP
nr:reverse transcriptase domain-containing protein [Tanacetum cinerariifolium]